jgi:hypothetical protein
MNTHRDAACSCGQLKAEVTGDPVRVSICHCLACQRRTGSVFGQQARYPKEQVKISGQATRWARPSDDGGEAAFYFCPVCGSTVYYEFEGLEAFWSIPVGVFADPEFPAPWVSVYEGTKHPWVHPPENAEREV